MGRQDLPDDIRTILLAYPRKCRRSRKYVPPVYIPGTIDSGVSRGAIRGEPVENWRLNQLSKPRRKVEKYVFVPEEGVGTGIPLSALTIETSERTDDLSKPYIRKLVCNRELFKFTGEKFVKNINNTIDKSWATVYNYYKRQLFKKQKKKRKKLPKGSVRKDSKGKPLSEKEMKERRLKEIAERSALLATPKKKFPPTPLPPRKVGDLEAMTPRLTSLSEPKYPIKKYIRPSIDPTWVDPTRVSEAARTCTPTDRTKELATNPAHKVKKVKDIIPGVVKRGALRANPTERVLVLATPKKKANETDNDLKENPFAISANAMKYVASARIRELAKPIER